MAHRSIWIPFCILAVLIIATSPGWAQDATINFREGLAESWGGYYNCYTEDGDSFHFEVASPPGLGFGAMDLGGGGSVALDTLGIVAEGSGSATHLTEIWPAGSGLVYTADLLSEGTGGGGSNSSGWATSYSEEVIYFEVFSPMVFSLDLTVGAIDPSEFTSADVTFIFRNVTLEQNIINLSADEAGSYQISGNMTPGVYEVDVYCRGEGEGGYCGASGPEGGTGQASIQAQLLVTPAPGFTVQAQYFQPPENYHPIGERSLRVYKVNQSDPNNYLSPLGEVVTDTLGVALVDFPELEPGDEILFQTVVQEQPATRPGRNELDNQAWTVTLENLLLESNDGTMVHDIVPAGGDTLWATLDHAVMNINLLASVEWQATAAYTATLQESIRKTAIYLYDVFNGQVRLDKVRLIDDKRNWNEADIQVFASNQAWPCAIPNGLGDNVGSLQMPPVHVGNKASNAFFAYDLDPPDLTYSAHFRTLGHELGHYALDLLDEYIDQTGNSVFPDTSGTQADINFGMMDTHYAGQAGNNEIMTSELSSAEALIPLGGDYSQTSHYQERGQTDCWDYFTATFSDTAAALPWRFKRPEDMNAELGQVIPGPNEGVLDGRNVGAEVQFFVDTSPSGRPRLPLTLQGPDGTPADDAAVGLIKPNLQVLSQGLATDAGEIRLLGADTGDQMTFSWQPATGGLYVGGEVISPAKVNQVITLQPVAEELRFLAAATPEVGGTTALTVADRGYLGAVPLLNLSLNGLSQTTPLSPVGEGYRLSLADSAWTTGSMMLTCQDANGLEFLLPIHGAQWDSVGAGQRYLAGQGVMIDTDQTALNVLRLTTLIVDFRPPRDGLPADALRLSEVVSVQAGPASGPLTGRVTLPIRTDRTGGVIPSGAAVHHWQNGWVPLVSNINTHEERVSANLSDPGQYAVFAVPGNGVSDVPEGGSLPRQGLRLHPASPNPFNPSTTIAFDLPRKGQVRLEAYDVRGRKVATLIDQVLEKGSHHHEWRPRRLPSGVYHLVLRQGSWQEVSRVTLIK